jgi:hypothetical protein
VRSKSDLQILRTSIGARARPPHGPRGMQHASRDHHAIARACMVSAPPGDAWSPTRGGCRGGGSPVLVRYVCPSFCFRFQYMTRGWGLRPGGVLVGSLTCCRSYSCGGGSVPCLAVCRWALLVGVSLLGKKACVFVQIEESVVTVFDCTWACKEAEQQAQWQQGGAW